MQNLWGDQYLPLDSTWFGNQSYWPPHSMEQCCTLITNIKHHNSFINEKGPRRSKKLPLLNFLTTVFGDWIIFFSLKTFFCIHVNIASVNTEDLQGAWLSLMTNKNALKSSESCLFGDKIRNEEMIRPRAVILVSSELCTGSEKVKSCSSPIVTQRKNKRLFTV